MTVPCLRLPCNNVPLLFSFHSLEFLSTDAGLRFLASTISRSLIIVEMALGDP